MEMRCPSPPTPARGKRLEALTGLADALRFGATPDEISELRTMSRALPTASPSPSGRRLPTIGAPQPQSGLTTLVQGHPQTGLAGRFRSDPDAAWVEWRQSLGKGLETDGVLGPQTAEMLTKERDYVDKLYLIDQVSSSSRSVHRSVH